MRQSEGLGGHLHCTQEACAAQALVCGCLQQAMSKLLKVEKRLV